MKVGPDGKPIEEPENVTLPKPPDNPQPPKPIEVKPVDNQPDVTNQLLKEWNDFKTEIGWTPIDKRTPPKDTKKKKECCILYPYCWCSK